MVFRAEAGTSGLPAPAELRGSDQVAQVVIQRGTPVAHLARPAVVEGRAGAVVARGDRVASVMACRVEGGRITEMDLLLNPGKLARVKV